MEINPKHSSKEDVATVTKGIYEPILLAGTGGVGDTWICKRNPPAAAAAPATETSAEEGQMIPLYAVKLPSERRQEFLQQEITALWYVTLSIAAPTDKHLQKYVDHDKSTGNEKDAAWLASKAVMGCTLLQLTQAAEAFHMALPKPLVLTIALQLCDALQALRELEPQFFHEDLALSNIMLDVEKRGDNGAPTVVIIDFGRGRSRKTSHEHDLDLSMFHRDVGQIADLCDTVVGQDPMWDSFVEVLVPSKQFQLEGAPYQSFRTRFKAYGDRIWDSMSEEEKQIIDAMLKEASKVMLKARAMVTEAVAKNDKD
ncbi:hypothetical protein SLS60_011066 [Paraconiothyrium brasiliense]|uniref:EKC/KEOPS complex subunit BUD32 n=1 Tax=Paraconiothyrium brasiliense TaxID=300254 RepID=A0ABR3QKI5_9PLEO